VRRYRESCAGSGGIFDCSPDGRCSCRPALAPTAPGSGPGRGVEVFHSLRIPGAPAAVFDLVHGPVVVLSREPTGLYRWQVCAAAKLVGWLRVGTPQVLYR